jgi:hypothetical protein
MSLDTKQKRGSAISMSLPWRAWVSDPSGISEFADRLSFVHFASASGGAERGGFLLCGTISVTPLLSGSVSVSALLSGDASMTPLLAGDVELDCECGTC